MSCSVLWPMSEGAKLGHGGEGREPDHHHLLQGGADGSHLLHHGVSGVSF